MVYYVDGLYGSDAADGLTRQTAFATTARVNALALSGGDEVRFRCGAAYPGTLRPRRADGDGQILITHYGVGALPVIEADGEAAIDLVDISGVTLCGLAATAPNGLFGIRVLNEAGGEMRHIHIKSCHVYDVYGGHERFFICTGGIVATSGHEHPGWFSDLLIEDNHIEDVCRTGVILHTYWSNRPWKTWAENEYVSDSENWWPSYGVVWRGNLIERPAGDAMVLIGAIDPLMEHNTAYHVMNDPKPPCANAGIWPQSSNGCVIRFNEVGYCQKPEGCNDAQGYDVDLSCRDTLIEHNYSHDNAGGFLLLCENSTTADADGYRGTVVRNNLSVNDGGVKGELIALVGPVRGALIENNTFFSSGNMERLVEVWTADGQNQAADVTVRGNLFFSNGRDARYHLANGERFTIEHNLYWGAHRDVPPQDTAGESFDPQLACSGRTGDGRGVFAAYVPGAAMPNAAAPLSPAAQDLLGRDTGGAAYYGALIPQVTE